MSHDMHAYRQAISINRRRVGPEGSPPPVTSLSGWTVVTGTGEWSALYDEMGALVLYGDHYLVEDFIRAASGIQALHPRADAAWLHEVQGARAHPEMVPFLTLNEVMSAIAAVQSMRERADALEREAAGLLADAGNLRARAS